MKYEGAVSYYVGGEFDAEGRCIRPNAFTATLNEQWAQKRRDDQLTEINRKLDLIIKQMGIAPDNQPTER